MKKIIILVILFLGSRAMIYGAGETGMQFLKVGADARGNSLSGAIIGTVGGVDSIYWNPAGLSKEKNMEMMITYNQWIAGMSYFYAGFGMPLLMNKFGGIGVSLLFMNEGTLEEVKGSIYNLESLDSYDLAISVAYGMRLWKINLGSSVRFITKNILGFKSKGMVMDIGAQMEIPGINGLNVGMVGKNLGFATAIEDNPDSMPIMFQVGVDYKYIKDNNSIIAMLSSDIMSDELPYINIGVEYGYKETVYIRAGYKLDTENTFEGVKGLSVGVGGWLKNIAMMDRIKVDITFLPMADFGNIMQFSLTVSF